MLRSRIDRLAPTDRGLLEAAAVIGRNLPLWLLQAVSDVSEEELREGLGRLQAAEFLHEIGSALHLEYTFRHALTQDLAYAKLPLDHRRDVHARIASAIQQRPAGRFDEQTEQLAYHTFRGELWDEAVRYLRQAGDKAQARSAHREAVTFFELTLTALEHLPPKRDVAAQAVDVRLALHTSLLPIGEIGRTLEHLRRAETAARTLDDPRRLCRISAYLTNALTHAGDNDGAVKHAESALSLATSLGDSALKVKANFYLGEVHFLAGRYGEATDLAGRALELARGHKLRGVEAWTLRLLGEIAFHSSPLDVKSAESYYRRALALAGELGMRPLLARGYLGLGALYRRTGNRQQAAECFTTAMTMLREMDMGFWLEGAEAELADGRHRLP